MADIWVKVLTKADSYALLTLDELKTMLGLPLTDTSEDVQLQMWIDQYSDVIATMCNRVFAYEEVQETWRGDSMPFDCPRLFLTHYPVADDDLETIESPRSYALDPAVYELENESGKLRLDGAWAEPIVVRYWGGYKLPDEAPQALKTATGLLIQAARLQMRRNATSGIRSISHRESRVMFFDVAQMTGKGAGPLDAAGDTVSSLLTAYMRYYV